MIRFRSKHRLSENDICFYHALYYGYKKKYPKGSMWIGVNHG